MNRLEGHFHRLVVEESCPGDLVDLCVKMAGGSERERTKLYLPSVGPPAGPKKKKKFNFSIVQSYRFAGSLVTPTGLK